MKNLQDLEEKRWQFTSVAMLDAAVRRPENPDEVILLLHGLNERGRRIFRKLLPYLPQNAFVVAPNGPFPLPRYKEDRLDFGYAWYFYDKFKKNYVINQDLAKNWLKELLRLSNPQKLPLTIIGFSQGGYLAPLAGLCIDETKLVIGIGCEFRNNLLPDSCPFPLVAVHGKMDEIVSHQWAAHEIELLKERGYTIEWNLIEEAKHEIDKNVGHKVKDILERYGEARLQG